MPIESSARRPTFSEEGSARVVMADGQEWALRRPSLRLRPKFSGGRAVSAATSPYLEGGSELESLLAAVTADGDFVAAAMSVGAYLLSFNYDLTDADLEALFAFGGSDAEGTLGWARRIMQVANGIDAPKAPTSGGDAAPCS